MDNFYIRKLPTLPINTRTDQNRHIHNSKQ